MKAGQGILLAPEVFHGPNSVVQPFCRLSAAFFPDESQLFPLIPGRGGFLLFSVDEAVKELCTAIFAEIKPEWSVNHNWMILFAQTLAAMGYVPGFIGNTDSSKNFNFDRQCSHYVKATEGVNQFGAVYCATEPKRKGMPKKWAPYCPSALEPEDIHLWASGKTTFCQFVVDDIYAQNEKVLANTW